MKEVLREKMERVYIELDDIYNSQQELISSTETVMDNLTLLGVPIAVLVQIQERMSILEGLSIDKPAKEMILYGYSEALSVLSYVESITSSLDQFKINADCINSIVRSAIDVLNMEREEVIKECIRILTSSDVAF